MPSGLVKYTTIIPEGTLLYRAIANGPDEEDYDHGLWWSESFEYPVDWIESHAKFEEDADPIVLEGTATKNIRVLVWGKFKAALAWPFGQSRETQLHVNDLEGLDADALAAYVTDPALKTADGSLTKDALNLIEMLIDINGRYDFREDHPALPDDIAAFDLTGDGITGDELYFFDFPVPIDVAPPAAKSAAMSSASRFAAQNKRQRTYGKTHVTDWARFRVGKRGTPSLPK